MKKRKIIDRLLAIKSDQYNSEFHSDYQRQKRNSPLLKTKNALPKIIKTINKNLFVPKNYPATLTLGNSSRNQNNSNSLLVSTCSETEQVIYPKIFQNNFYIKDTNSAFRRKIEKKNSGILSMKYLDLFHLPKEYNYLLLNKLIQNEDKFFEDEILEKISDKIIREKVITELKKYKENEITTMENFVRKTLGKNENEKESFLLIEKIPNEIIENSAELIYKEYLNIINNKNKELIKNKKNNVDENKISVPKQYNELIIHNVFFEFALKNVRNRIELRNQYNKELSLDYISKLIKNEIKKLKLMISKVQNLSNEKSAFSTKESYKNRQPINMGQYNNFITNNLSPLSPRYYNNIDLKHNNLNNRSLKLNSPSKLGYMVKNNDYLIYKNMGNINNFNNDNMYITGVGKDYNYLLENTNLDLTGINNIYSSIRLNKKNILNKTNLNNINSIPKQFIEVYNNKRIKKEYNYKDNKDSNFSPLPRINIQINEDKKNNKISRNFFSPTLDQSKIHKENIQKFFKQDNINENIIKFNNSLDNLKKNENNQKKINYNENKSNIINNKNIIDEKVYYPRKENNKIANNDNIINQNNKLEPNKIDEKININKSEEKINESNNNNKESNYNKNNIIKKDNIINIKENINQKDNKNNIKENIKQKENKNNIIENTIQKVNINNINNKNNIINNNKNNDINKINDINNNQNNINNNKNNINNNIKSNINDNKIQKNYKYMNTINNESSKAS